MEFSERAAPATVVMIPKLPTPGEDSEELCAAVTITVGVPHTGRIREEFHDRYGSYAAALASPEVKASFDLADPSHAPAQQRAAWRAGGKAGDVVVLSWLDALASYDPVGAAELLPKGADGKPATSATSCWACGKTATADGSDLLNCSRCKTAKFCGAACQKEAWWWHKAAGDGAFGCVAAGGAGHK
mmetsp:Transcript_12894/g.35391  ORF Transcript_12894/g.35391 Transcript_12894/m.35391 type:complete len:187 (-) Transcript_12894:138-698(-)